MPPLHLDELPPTTDHRFMYLLPRGAGVVVAVWCLTEADHAAIGGALLDLRLVNATTGEVAAQATVSRAHTSWRFEGLESGQPWKAVLGLPGPAYVTLAESAVRGLLPPNPSRLASAPPKSLPTPTPSPVPAWPSSDRGPRGPRTMGAAQAPSLEQAVPRRGASGPGWSGSLTRG